MPPLERQSLLLGLNLRLYLKSMFMESISVSPGIFDDVFCKCTKFDSFFSALNWFASSMIRVSIGSKHVFALGMG